MTKIRFPQSHNGGFYCGSWLRVIAGLLILPIYLAYLFLVYLWHGRIPERFKI